MRSAAEIVGAIAMTLAGPALVNGQSRPAKAAAEGPAHPAIKPVQMPQPVESSATTPAPEQGPAPADISRCRRDPLPCVAGPGKCGEPVTPYYDETCIQALHSSPGGMPPPADCTWVTSQVGGSWSCGEPNVAADTLRSLSDSLSEAQSLTTQQQQWRQSVDAAYDEGSRNAEALARQVAERPLNRNGYASSPQPSGDAGLSVVNVGQLRQLRLDNVFVGAAGSAVQGMAGLDFHLEGIQAAVDWAGWARDFADGRATVRQNVERANEVVFFVSDTLLNAGITNQLRAVARVGDRALKMFEEAIDAFSTGDLDAYNRSSDLTRIFDAMLPHGGFEGLRDQWREVQGVSPRYLGDEGQLVHWLQNRGSGH